MEGLLLFFIFIAEARQNIAKVELNPYPTAVVEENDALQLSCKLNLETNWTSLIFQTSKYVGTLVVFVSYGNCEYKSGLDAKSLENYDLKCDFQNQSFNLTIAMVSSNDHSTTFDCIVNTDHSGTHLKNSTRIYVQVPVKSVEINRTGNLAIHENNKIELQCQSSPSRPAANITWYKRPPGKDQPILLQSNKLLSKRGTLGDLFKTTTDFVYVGNSSDNGGVIYCEADNGASRVRSTTLTVMIFYEPTITSLRVTNHSDYFNLTCIVDSFPSSNISWLLKDKTVLQTEYFIWTSNIMINGTSCGKTTYTCTAANGIRNKVQKAIETQISCVIGVRLTRRNSLWIFITAVVLVVLIVVGVIIATIAMRKRSFVINRFNFRNRNHDDESEHEIREERVYENNCRLIELAAEKPYQNLFPPVESCAGEKYENLEHLTDMELDNSVFNSDTETLNGSSENSYLEENEINGARTDSSNDEDYTDTAIKRNSYIEMKPISMDNVYGNVD